jgi:hypothetical protein
MSTEAPNTTNTPTPETPKLDIVPADAPPDINVRKPPQDPPKKTKATLEHFSENEVEKRVQDQLNKWLDADKSPAAKKANKDDQSEETPAEETDEATEKPDEKKPETKKKPAKKATEEAEETPAVEEEEPQPKRKKPKAAERDDDKLEKAVEKLADKLDRKQQKSDTQSTLSKKDEQKLKVFEHMGKENSEYATLARDYKAFVAREQQYKAKWEKENPGEAFNPTDDAHSEWYDKNEPTYDQEDYIEAKVDLVSNEKVDKLTRQEREKAEKQRQEQEVETRSEKITADTHRQLAKEIVGKELDLEELETEDPVAYDFISRATSDANSLIAEAVKIASNPGLIDRKNPLHETLLNRLEVYDEALSDVPEAKTRIKEGGRYKDFATLKEFLRMAPEDQADYWTVYTHPDQSKKYIIKDFSELVKADIDRKEKLFAQRLEKRNSGGSQNSGEPKQKQAAPRHESPTITGGDRKVTPVDALKPKVEDEASQLEKWFNAR